MVGLRQRLQHVVAGERRESVRASGLNHFCPFGGVNQSCKHHERGRLLGSGLVCPVIRQPVQAGRTVRFQTPV